MSDNNSTVLNLTIFVLAGWLISNCFTSPAGTTENYVAPQNKQQRRKRRKQKLINDPIEKETISYTRQTQDLKAPLTSEQLLPNTHGMNDANCPFVPEIKIEDSIKRPFYPKKAPSTMRNNDMQLGREFINVKKIPQSQMIYGFSTIEPQQTGFDE